MGKLAKKSQRKPQKKFVQKEKQNLPKTRKDIRKEKRSIKKIHRKEYYGKNKKKEVGKFVKLPDNGFIDENNPTKFNDVEKKNKTKSSENTRLMNDIEADKKREKRLITGIKEHRKNQLMRANEDEDKIIKKLEKQLKLKKNKTGTVIPKSFSSDGLSYLLEVCDSDAMSPAIATEKHLLDSELESDFEEDFAIATGKVNTKDRSKSKSPTIESDHMEDSSSEDFELDESSDDEMEQYKSKKTTKSALVESKAKRKKSPIVSSPPNCDFKIENNVKTPDEYSPVMKKLSKKIREFNVETTTDDDKCKADINDTCSEESDNTSEEENLHNGELSEEELEMLYTGASAFPDGVYRPENLTPICEETESDIENYKNGKEAPPVEHGCIHEDSIECESVDNESETYVDDMSESYDDDMSENSSIVGSDGSECESIEEFVSSCEGSESENEQIIVNGKIVNTYGREIITKCEEDIVRCSELDKILASISDSETEPEKLPHRKNISNNSSNTDSSAADKVKGKLKKKRKNPAVDDADQKTVNKIRKIENKITPPNTKCLNLKNKKVTEDASDMSDEDDHSGSSDSLNDIMSCDSESDVEDDEEIKRNVKDDGTWEDIYGRKRDEDGNVITDDQQKYVPPHLRKLKSDAESVEITQLKRQIKSLLNKVAGSNMHWISSQLELIYNTHSRYAVNSAFCSLWMDAVIQPVAISDRLVIEHSVLLAIMHANVGSEIGAHFLQTIVKRFDEMFRTEQKLQNKELDNLVLGLSQMYNFKIFHSSLLYEILNKFVENLSEKNIECVLVALRGIGGVLRKEDPAALKVFIHSAQEKAGNFRNTTSGSRVNFLLDVLLAIKNNNLNKIPNYDPSYSEELKKSMKSILRKGNSVVPLNIKLEDLLNVEERGRWWVVGSAWESGSKLKPIANNANDEKDSQQLHLLKLADKLHINTSLRRNIFCIIMSAEDYIDAFEKLQHLGLKHQQEREIIQVLIVCCLQEKVYNPYYSVLAQRYCDYNRKFQMSIQYTVWDKLKDLDKCSMFQISNLAQFLTHLFIEKGLPISILKVIEFAELSKPTLRLMRQILLGVMLHKNSQTTLEVFQRVAVSPKLHLFRESLRLFISHFLLKNSNKKENVLSEEEMSLLKERASTVDKILQSDSKLRF